MTDLRLTGIVLLCRRTLTSPGVAFEPAHELACDILDVIDGVAGVSVVNGAPQIIRANEADARTLPS